MRYRVAVLDGLIVVGLLGIGVSLIVNYGFPYWHELQFEKYDEQRINDINALDASITVALSKKADDQPHIDQVKPPVEITTTKEVLEKAPIATTSAEKTRVPTIDSKPKEVETGNTVYISIPSDSPTCDGAYLPSLPSGWQYHCVDAVHLTKTDGSGWLPIDFDHYAPDRFRVLPIDPVNNVDTLNYYMYVQNKPDLKTQYVLTVVLDSSNSFQRERDNGVDPIRYEKGSVNLWEMADGVIANWPKTADDNTHFDGIFSRIKIANTGRVEQLGKKGQSYSIIIKFRTPVFKDQSLIEKWDGTTYPFAIRGPLPNIQLTLYDEKNLPTISTIKKNYADNEWHTIVGIRDANQQTLSMYADGTLVSVVADTTTMDLNNTADIYIGSRNPSQPKFFTGDIEFVK